MKNFSFLVPTDYNHLFVDYSEKGPIYFRDKDLTYAICENEKITEIKTLLPDNLSKIEISKVVTNFENVSDTIDYFHLWPFPHMEHADIIVDGKHENRFPLFNYIQKSHYKETMESLKWNESLFIIYTKKDKSKIGFLLFR